MLSDRKLNQQQKIGFLREGHLVIQGDFSVGMIADLLELLETNEDDSRGRSPSGETPTDGYYPA
jgi:hypothetical protein